VAIRQPSRLLHQQLGDQGDGVAASLWRNGAFLRLWTGDAVSQLGTAVTGLALPLTAIVSLGAGAAEMGLLAAARQAPYLLTSLFAGVWVDRLPRRRIMVLTDLGRGLLLAWVPLAAFLGVLRVEQLYLVAFGIGLQAVFAEIAATSIVPTIVAREQIFDANGRLQITSSVANVGGPGIAGVLIQAIGAPAAILVDVASFVGSALLVGSIRAQEPPRPARAAGATLWREIKEGLVGLLGIRVIRDMTISSALGNLGLQIGSAVLFLYLIRDLGMEPALVGAIFAVSSVASIAGAAVASRVGRRIGPGPAVVLGTLLFEAGLLARPFAAGPLPVAVAVLVVAQVVLGFGTPIYSVNQIGVRQQMTPDHLLGRVNASRRFIVFGVGPIGGLVGGLLGEAIGLRPTLFVGGLVATVAFLWIVLSPVRSLREVPAR
jgi:MFS family permease